MSSEESKQTLVTVRAGSLLLVERRFIHRKRESRLLAQLAVIARLMNTLHSQIHA